MWHVQCSFRTAMALTPCVAALQINITITAQNDSTAAISQLVQQALASGTVQSALQASGELSSSLNCLPVLGICWPCCSLCLPSCVQHLPALLLF